MYLLKFGNMFLCCSVHLDCFIYILLLQILVIQSFNTTKFFLIKLSIISNVIFAVILFWHKILGPIYNCFHHPSNVIAITNSESLCSWFSFTNSHPLLPSVDIRFNVFINVIHHWNCSNIPYICVKLEHRSIHFLIML